ncbi:sulfite exporter TauE/SafE family protein [Nibrella saemangeumensis]|uniref:Probable membrane transporter protein n=1 Tax=Nibrella saemangeumensis TaxID=1084526 RepID=A0ABP8N246_9BACT
MEYIVIGLTALIGSGLTLFSGFGLGTLLLPVFGLFFPIELAVVLTAIVHFLNNLFKLALLGRHADKAVILRFGLPSIVAAIAGAYILTLLTDARPLLTYSLNGTTLSILPVKLIMALLMIVFALFDLVPRLSALQFDPKYLPLGGLLSGFFGGLSGHQGALRSAFLLRTHLSKEAFIATGIVIACLIDVSRLTVYATRVGQFSEQLNYPLLLTATLCAYVGAFAGNRLLKRVTIRFVQHIVGSMLLVFAVLLGAGII